MNFKHACSSSDLMKDLSLKTNVTSGAVGAGPAAISDTSSPATRGSTFLPNLSMSLAVDASSCTCRRVWLAWHLARTCGA